MTRSLFLMILVALLAGVSAWAAAKHHHHLRLQDAAAAELAVQEARQAQSAELAAHFANLVRQSDYVIFNFHNLYGQKEVLVRDRDWLNRMADLLAAVEIQATQKHHFGISAPNLEFFSNHEKVLHLDTLGRDTLRAYGLVPDENGSMHKGDYQVDEATLVALRSLVREKIPPSYPGRGR